MIRHYAIVRPEVTFWDIPTGTTLSLITTATYVSFDDIGYAGACDPGGPISNVTIGFTVDVDASAEEIERAMLAEVVAQGVIADVPVTKKDILYTPLAVR